MYLNIIVIHTVNKYICVFIHLRNIYIQYYVTYENKLYANSL